MKTRSALRVLSVLLIVAVAGMVADSYVAFRNLDPGRQEGAAPVARMDAGRREEVLQAYTNLPVTFVENQGQLDPQVRYYAQGARYGFYFTPDSAVLSFVKASDVSPDLAAESLDQGVALALRFLGSNPQVMLAGEERAPGTANYLRGNDPASWQTGLSRYTQVVYRELWPGVNLMLHEQAGKLKYEFRVRPGARVADIRLGYSGADGLTLDHAGGLRIETLLGVLNDSPPVSYQEIAGARVPVASRYVLHDDGGYGFTVGAGYQPDHELIIDPSLDYATFLGGSSDDYVNDIAIDASGNAYLVGTTQSANFPTTTGAFDRSLASTLDVFVAKLNSTGTALVYSTYLGGTPTPVPAGGADPFEFGRGIAVDASGNAYITGQTTSSNFPTTSGAFDRSLNVSTFDATDAFVTKLNATGSGLVYSTFLGGTDIDDGMGIALDSAGNAYVTGETGSSNFPTTSGAIDTSINGAFDAFVTKLNATGSALVYSTYLGGTEVDYGQRPVIDTAGNAYVMGATRSPNFPTTPGAFDTSENGLFDAFILKINPAGSALVYSTFLGGLDMDGGGGLAIDATGNAYISGGTASADFPTTPGAFDTTLNDSDAFVTKLNPAGSALVYSTLLGGSAGEGAGGIALDSAGNAWLTGGTGSADFPVTVGAIDTTFNGVTDAYVAQVNAAGSALLYATFIGGVNPEGGNDLALDTSGAIYVAGKTYSPDFPTTPGAFDVVFNGDPSIFWGDAFILKLGTGTAPAPALSTVTLNPTSVTGGGTSTGTVTLTAAAPGGGATVALASSNTAVATVPASVSVAAGATSATFMVSTSSVSIATTVTISAVYSSVTRTATLTVTSPATGPLPAPTLLSPANDARFRPGQAITFDWSDVAGAANYTIQIDDSQNFSAPLVVSQTTTASQFTTSTLPTRRMWWRVRGNDASGTPGNWSSVRRFEVKN